MYEVSLIQERPCTRCVKKGIGESCVEGVRKKAKYLLEGDERSESTYYTRSSLTISRSEFIATSRKVASQVSLDQHSKHPSPTIPFPIYPSPPAGPYDPNDPQPIFIRQSALPLT